VATCFSAQNLKLSPAHPYKGIIFRTASVSSFGGWRGVPMRDFRTVSLEIILKQTLLSNIITRREFYYCRGSATSLIGITFVG
jgi:hypothetical protein